MVQLARYALGIIGGSLLVGVLGSFPLGSAGKKLIQFLGGVFLTLLLLRPVAQFDWDALTLAPYLDLGEAAAADGQAMTADAVASIIKSRTEAYILDKAASLDAAVEAWVELDGDHVPASVTLEGTISPYARARLSAILEENLGISKEHQRWKNG